MDGGSAENAGAVFCPFIHEHKKAPAALTADAFLIFQAVRIVRFPVGALPTLPGARVPLSRQDEFVDFFPGPHLLLRSIES